MKSCKLRHPLAGHKAKTLRNSKQLLQKEKMVPEDLSLVELTNNKTNKNYMSKSLFAQLLDTHRHMETQIHIRTYRLK